MGENRDTSAMFSLKELMTIEEQRIQEEEAARQRARAAAAEARAQAARKQREEEGARAQLEEERRRAEISRRREEEARLSAMRAAEIEKARIEAESRGRIEVMARQAEQERALVALRSSTSGARRAAGIGVAVAAAAIAAGAAFYYGQIKPEADRAAAAQQAVVAERDEQNRKLQDEQRKLEQKIADAERQIFEEKKKKAIAMATAEPRPTTSARILPAGPKPQKSCKPCADRDSPLCGLDGCELNR